MTGPLIRPDGKLSGDGGFLRPGDSRDILVAKFEIEKDHFLKMKPLYEALHNDMAEDGWQDPVSGDDKFESLYWERTLANGFKEHHVWWRAVNYPMGKDGYFRYAAKIDIQTLAARSGEIAYKGKKKTLDRVDFIMRFWFWVQWDPHDKFKNSIVKNFQQKFMRHIYKNEIEQQWQNLYNYSIKIQKFVKTYLDMETGVEDQRLFHPEGGYKDPYAP